MSLVQQANRLLTEETNNEETMAKYRKLEEQLKVCEELGDSEDTMVVKREVAMLENILKELKEAITYSREGLQGERRIEVIIIKGTAELDRLKVTMEGISSKEKASISESIPFLHRETFQRKIQIK